MNRKDWELIKAYIDAMLVLAQPRKEFLLQQEIERIENAKNNIETNIKLEEMEGKI